MKILCFTGRRIEASEPTVTKEERHCKLSVHFACGILYWDGLNEISSSS